jgi:phenylalanyl-tRNA synthetase beta chain
VVDGNTIGRFGEVEETAVPSLKLRQPVFVAELNLERLYRSGLRQIDFQEPSRYPAVERDFSFIFPNAVQFGAARSAVEALRIAELRSFTPVEIFRGGAIPAGSYSLLLRASFQSNQRTLRDEEVAGWCSQIVRALEKLGGSLRAQ